MIPVPRRGSRVTAMENRAQALAEIAWDVLRRAIRELAERKAGGHLIEGRLDVAELRVPLASGGGEEERRAFARDLVASIDGALDDAIQHAAAFRPGHAFCHRCGVASCEHSEPPSGRHVFRGYASSGVPRWEDFGQVCLDMKHPEVDRLFDDPPAFITFVQPGRVLNAALVGTFPRERAFELIGQVIAGFWPVRAREGEGRGVVALTLQAAMSRPTHGPPKVGLNLIGRTPQGQPLEFLWERHDDIPWRQSVRWAHAALGTVARGRRGGGLEIPARVEAILRGLARRLERDRRSRVRRTRHAQERHVAGDRPTRKALEDAGGTRADEVLYDERNRTFVIPGDRGRTHFFTLDGRLVSSVRYSRDAIERKRKLGFWREAAREEAERLLAGLGGIARD